MEKSKKNKVKLVPGSLLIFFGTITLLSGIRQGLLFILMGGLFVYSYSKTKRKIEKEEKGPSNEENKYSNLKSPIFRKIWNKKKSELIKLLYFLLNMKSKDYGNIEVIKFQPKDSEWGILDECFIQIRNKDTWYGITINDITHDPYKKNKRNKIQFIGTKSTEELYDGSLNTFNLKEKERLNWIIKNIDKSDFGISDYFENQDNKVLTKKNKITTFFNKNKITLEGKDFEVLLKKHQTKIIDIDRNYIKQFVKVSNYLRTKNLNILTIFNLVKKTKTIEDFELYEGFLKNEVYLFNLVLFNSLNMIISLIEDEMITFYEIYDMFDKLNIFDSNWEIEVSQKLENIDTKLDELINSIDKMSMKLTLQLQQLFLENEKTNRILSEELKSINSSIDSNGLLQLISTYQLYKINKNTKNLKG
jgi:hypothetical protein